MVVTYGRLILYTPPKYAFYSNSMLVFPTLQQRPAYIYDPSPAKNKIIISTLIRLVFSILKYYYVSV